MMHPILIDNGTLTLLPNLATAEAQAPPRWAPPAPLAQE